MSIYLDTQVAVWLAQGDTTKLSEGAKAAIRSKPGLLISPMVEIELEYLYEIKRTMLSSQDILIKLQAELGVSICTLPFEQVSRVAIAEKWTRDPFDRIIVAQAKANGLSVLISADRQVQANYPRTICT